MLIMCEQYLIFLKFFNSNDTKLTTSSQMAAPDTGQIIQGHFNPIK